MCGDPMRGAYAVPLALAVRFGTDICGRKKSWSLRRERGSPALQRIRVERRRRHGNLVNIFIDESGALRTLKSSAKSMGPR